jgi:hypothetical protein
MTLIPHDLSQRWRQEVPCKHWYLLLNYWTENHNRNLHSEENLKSHTAVELYIDVTKPASLKRPWKREHSLKRDSNIWLWVLSCGSLSVGRVRLWTKDHGVCFYNVIRRLPLWCNGASSWLHIQRFRVRFPALSEFLRSSGSTHSREDNWEAAWMKKVGNSV